MTRRSKHAPKTPPPASTTEAAARELADGNLIVEIARRCHEANRGYCASIGDNSQVAWDDAPEWQKTSCVNGVKFVIANPAAGDSAQHDNWMKEKVAAGWVYGEVKDPDAKTHPCILPFEQLPPEQQEKDRIFRRTVLAALDEIDEAALRRRGSAAGAQGEADAPQDTPAGAWPFPNLLAAAAAASFAYGTENTHAPRFGFRWLMASEVEPAELDFVARARTAAAFVRSNPDAPAEAIPIQLKLKGFRDVPPPGPRELAAWRVFAFALKELARVDMEAARLAQFEAARTPPRPSAHADQMALMPQPGSFDPSGFTPRR